MEKRAGEEAAVDRYYATIGSRLVSGGMSLNTKAENLGHLLAWEGTRYYFRRLGDMRDDAVVRALVELIYSGGLQRRSRLRELSPYWRWLTTKVPRDDIEAYLLASDRSERGLFEAFMRIYADRRGNAIMGEKTPAHLAYVETLRKNGHLVLTNALQSARTAATVSGVACTSAFRSDPMPSGSSSRLTSWRRSRCWMARFRACTSCSISKGLVMKS